jgi:hypothetical protein
MCEQAQLQRLVLEEKSLELIRNVDKQAPARCLLQQQKKSHDACGLMQPRLDNNA